MSSSGEVRVRLSIDGKLLGRHGQAARIRKLLEEGKLKRLRVTFVPTVVGGADAPTLLGVPGRSLLEKSVPLRLGRMRQKGRVCQAVYRVTGRGKFASEARLSAVKKTACKSVTRKNNSSAA